MPEVEAGAVVHDRLLRLPIQLLNTHLLSPACRGSFRVSFSNMSLARMYMTANLEFIDQPRRQRSVSRSGSRPTALLCTILARDPRTDHEDLHQIKFHSFLMRELGFYRLLQSV